MAILPPPYTCFRVLFVWCDGVDDINFLKRTVRLTELAGEMEDVFYVQHIVTGAVFFFYFCVLFLKLARRLALLPPGYLFVVREIG